jgi:hypothetical protein
VTIVKTDKIKVEYVDLIKKDTQTLGSLGVVSSFDTSRHPGTDLTLCGEGVMLVHQGRSYLIPFANIALLRFPR